MNNNSDVNDTANHGTKVAGIMAAFTGSINGSKGIAGINYSAPILVGRVGNAGPEIDLAADAIEWAVNRGASAINASFSFKGLSSSEVASLKSAVDYAWNSNRIVVASSGNGPEPITGIYPASFIHVITVGASTHNDAWANTFSNYSDPSIDLWIDLVAPGVDICTTAIGNAYDCSPGADGTSFSAPFVTGVLGLLEKRYPNLTSQQVKSRITTTADKLPAYSFSGTQFCGGSGINKYVGCGRLDAYDAIR